MKRKKKIVRLPVPSLELSPFMLSQLSGALCIIVLRSQGVILRGLNKGQKKEI